jgi:hypothetical protein
LKYIVTWAALLRGRLSGGTLPSGTLRLCATQFFIHHSKNRGSDELTIFPSSAKVFTWWTNVSAA